MSNGNLIPKSEYKVIAGIEIRDYGSFITLVGSEGQPLLIEPDSANKITVKRVGFADTITGQEILERERKLRRNPQQVRGDGKKKR